MIVIYVLSKFLFAADRSIRAFPSTSKPPNHNPFCRPPLRIDRAPRPPFSNTLFVSLITVLHTWHGTAIWSVCRALIVELRAANNCRCRASVRKTTALEVAVSSPLLSSLIYCARPERELSSRQLRFLFGSRNLIKENSSEGLYKSQKIISTCLKRLKTTEILIRSLHFTKLKSCHKSWWLSSFRNTNPYVAALCLPTLSDETEPAYYTHTSIGSAGRRTLISCILDPCILYARIRYKGNKHVVVCVPGAVRGTDGGFRGQ